MTTLPIERQRRDRHGVPRSGGRTVGRDAAGYINEPLVDGAVALAPRRRAERPATGADEPRLRAAPPVPVSTPRTPFVVLVLTVVIVGVVGILVLNTMINENAFRLHDLRVQQSSLDLREQQLEQDLAQQESPVNLAASARRLGLVPSRRPAFIVLPDGRRLGMPQPAGEGR